MNFLKDLLYRLRGEYTTKKLISMGLVVGEKFNRLNGVILDPSHCWLIKIGNNVTLAPRVHILAHDASTKNFLGYTKIGRVDIGDNVFIGAESVVLPNVKIGNNVVIGANSVVTHNVSDNSVVAGNPARFICSIDDYLKKNKNLLQNSPVYDKKYTLTEKISDEMKKQMYNELENKIGYLE